MQRYYNYPIFMIFLCMGCTGNNSKTTNADSTSKIVQTPTNKGNAAPDRVVAGDAQSLISETNRNEALLFGKTLEVRASELPALLSQTIIESNLLMTNAKAPAIGPLTFAYLSQPGSGKQKIFIGQPVKKRFQTDNTFTFLRIPGGAYYKMQCNAETGNTAEYHKKMQEQLSAKSLEYGLPVLEIFSETRNNEMTVVSRATLLYPKK